MRGNWLEIIAFCLLYVPIQQNWRRLIEFNAREVSQSCSCEDQLTHLNIDE